MDRHDANKENRRPSSAFSSKPTSSASRCVSVGSLRDRDTLSGSRRAAPSGAADVRDRSSGSASAARVLRREATSALGTHLRRTPMTPMDVCAAPLVDDMLRAMREQEVVHAIRAADLAENVNLEHRCKVVAWLVKAFHVVNFDDAILYGCVQLADRYLVGCGKYVSGSTLQGVVMACLCSTLKLQTADCLTYSVPTLLSHITHNQISLDRVLRVERDVLVGVDFAVTVPTVQNFLDALAVRVMGTAGSWVGLHMTRPQEAVVGGPAEARPKFWHLADFLCQLTLLNHVFCERPGSLLASSALILSVWALDAPQNFKAMLLEDIGLVWSVKRKEDLTQLHTTVADLQEEWTTATAARTAMEAGEIPTCAPVVEKFSAPDRHEVAKIPAPAQPIRFRA